MPTARERELELRISQLEAELSTEKQRNQNREVHLIDDLVRLQGIVHKQAAKEITRLHEVRIAAQRTPPKLHIVDAYVADTIDALETLKEITRRTPKQSAPEPANFDVNTMSRKSVIAALREAGLITDDMDISAIPADDLRILLAENTRTHVKEAQ